LLDDARAFMPIWIETILLVAYALLGPGFWALMALAGAVGMRRMAHLRLKRRRVVRSPEPLVSILIPAKDEQQRIADCLESALAQNYPNFEVIAVDDRSADDTGAVMDHLAADHSRLKVIHLREGDLSEGWTGKCNALHHAVALAKGQWLLLVDSDVILSSEALPATLGVAAGRGYDLLSLFPRLECHTFWEELAVPLAGAALMVLHVVAVTNNDDRPTAFANGQFMLIRRSAYDAVGGHAAVRDQFCEDIEIARRIKNQGFRLRICWGAGLAAVRMYSSLASIRRGWGRIFYAAARGRPWRSIGGILLLLFSGWSVYAAIFWGIWLLLSGMTAIGIVWLCVAGIHLILMTALLAAAYRATGNPRRLALYFPLGAILLASIFIQAIKLCITGRLEWRGTKYAGKERYA
jgi:cellulose synthase/poly-beta-1,6-N-acetylglucosamine synthase-like glycosyltransferase